MKRSLLLAAICLMIAACRGQEPQEAGSEFVDSLPLQPIPMESLNAFQQSGANWQIVGDVWSDYQTEGDIQLSDGTGVLVNVPGETDNSNLTSTLEHGDIELKIEFLVPGGSNSGIYFQSRYELQILDSWRSETADFSSAGGIYERWDDTAADGQQGYDGHAPSVNAALAPGLWQEFHVLFRAPRFDESGNKIQNARFEFVRLNGQLIHENVELTGPTRGAVSEEEVTHAPIMIQGDHGPVAFRNIRYKRFEENESLSLGPLTYTVYDYEGVRLPDFDTLSVVLAEGVTESFNVSDLSPKSEFYAIRFEGDLNVPVSGDYLFQTQISNGGNLSIDGDLIVASDGEYESRRQGAITYLEAGTHSLEMTYFQRIWGTQLILMYEGPQMEWRSLASPQPFTSLSVNNPMVVNPIGNEAELIGGFTDHGDVKRTHTLSVGMPDGVHYSYDLQFSSLLKFWRGEYADVTRLWRGRGEEQLLVPMNAAVEAELGVVLATSNGNSVETYENITDQLSGQEYLLDENGLPEFQFVLDGVHVSDKISPTEEPGGLVRDLHYSSEASRGNFVALLAVGDTIEELPNGLYRVNGNHYIRIIESGGNDFAIRSSGEQSALVVPVLQNATSSNIVYELIW